MATLADRSTHTLVEFANILVITMVMAGFGFAYADTQETNAETLAEIVVTGSRIARRDFSSPSPIATIERITLDAATQPTLEETLNQMPQITPDLERTANNPGDGTARLNLRGLGSNRTLILLNGRRLAPSGVGSAVDLNNLPQTLIERIEIVTGGATTVYGSDAVAGVVNFITRENFEGFDLTLTAYTTQSGDADIYDANISLGHNWSNGKGNISAYGGYYDRKSLSAGERSFTAVPIRDINGTLTPGGSLATPSTVITFPLVNFGNGFARTTFDSNGTPIEFMDPADRYNFAPLNYLQTPLKRISLGLLFDYEITENSEIYSELSYARNESEQNLAPIPVGGLFFTNLDNPELSPTTQQFFANNFAPPFFPPGTAGYFLSHRLQELGPRIFDRTREYSRVVAGVRGDLGFGWDYDVWLTYTKTDEQTLLQNGASLMRFQQGMFVDPVSGQCFDPANGCAPVNIWGAGNLSLAGVDFIRLPELVNKTMREQQMLSGYIRGSAFENWAGAVELVVGIEWRRDEAAFKADPSLFSGDALGYRGSAGVDGRESVAEVYLEVLFPLAENTAFAEYLGLELGVRYSDYDHAGSAETYKVGAQWQPHNALTLRAMFQRSVRAPNIEEAFQDRFVEIGAFVLTNPTDDPCSASSDPIGNARIDACIATGLPASQVGTFEAAVGVPTNFIRGGNPNLQPEIADTFTIGGAVFLGASKSWQVSVDYFDLKIDDTIGDLVSTISCFDPANTENLFCNTITRDPNSFDVVQLVETKVNRGAQRTTGIDTQVAFKTVLPESLAISGAEAIFSANLTWTHLQRNDISQLSFGSTLHCAGRFGSPCSQATDGLTFPEDRVMANFSYLSGNLGVYLSWRWNEGTDNAKFQEAEFFGTPPPNLVIADIGSTNYFDLSASYQFSEHFSARLNISNLLDKGPPLLASAVTSNNTDTRLYDIFGRSYSLSVSLRY